MQRLVTPIGWREQARSILEGEHPRWGRPFEIFIYVLIVISMISVTIESIPQLPDNLRFSLSVAEVAIVAVFTLEYVLRNITAVRPLSYALSFWGFVDLIAIAPFYLSLGVEWRAARALRLLRLFQILKMFRRSGDRLVAAFKRVSGELLVFAGFALIVFYLRAWVSIYARTRRSPKPSHQFRTVFGGR
jgi:voltage-gated potassium channel